MECSCNINSCDEGYEVYKKRTITSKTIHKCGECNRKIPVGEKYEVYTGVFEGDRYRHKTCSDCLSFRNNFFGSWMFESLWEDFRDNMDDCGWQVPEKCLSKVTPATRAKICEMIEDYWMDYENEED